MSKQTLDLGGFWRLRGEDPSGSGRTYTLEAAAPGHVHAALVHAGILDDPFWRDAAAGSAWVQRCAWTYALRFDVPPSFPSGWTVLQFDGLAGDCTVRLNGHVLGKPASGLHPIWYEVGDFLRSGENRLDLAFAPMAQGTPCVSAQAPASLAGPAVWRDVRIEAFDAARIGECTVQTTKATPDRAEVSLRLAIESRTHEPLVAEIEIFGPDQRRRLHRLVDLGEPRLEAAFAVPEPALWWPNGHGPQPLYSAFVKLLGQEGRLLDQRRFCFGLRTVAFFEDADEAPIAIVNGRRVFLQGANWLPADPWPARVQPSRYDRWLALAQRAGVNCMRAWGGGIYEADAFWDACDRLGILVLQDFIVPEDASAQNEAAWAEIRREARHIVPHLTNHPSLAAWTSGTAPAQATLEALMPAFSQLDPERAFLRMPPPARNVPSLHADGTWENTDSREHGVDVPSGLVLDYRAPGAPCLASLLKFMTAEDAVEPTAKMWRFHSPQMPYWTTPTEDDLELPGASRVNEKNNCAFSELDHAVLGLYGRLQDPHLRLTAMEHLQCDWIRLACEAARRRAFDCTGLLFWTYNDSWPAVSSSLLDYYGTPKAGYYGMKRGFRPLIAAWEPLKDHVRLWLCSNRPQSTEARIRVAFQPWTGEPTWTRETSISTGTDAAQQVMEIARTGLASQGVLVADVAFEGGADRAIYYPGLPKDMALPSALLQVRHEQRPGGEGAVAITANIYARVVTLEGDAEFDDNYFDLMPGESRTIGWRPLDPRYAGPPRVRAWNGEAV